MHDLRMPSFCADAPRRRARSRVTLGAPPARVDGSGCGWLRCAQDDLPLYAELLNLKKMSGLLARASPV